MIIEEPDFKKAVQTADEILVSSKEIKAFPYHVNSCNYGIHRL